jgi:hypothetical protein
VVLDFSFADGLFQNGIGVEPTTHGRRISLIITGGKERLLLYAHAVLKGASEMDDK